MPTDVAIAAVAIKLPEFWTSNPNTWFAQAEAQFIIKNITSSLTKFYHVVAVLPQSVATNLADLIVKPPATDAYEDLKKRLVTSYSYTDYQKSDLLFNMPELGDRRPSELLSSMLSLVPDGESKTELFRFLFLRRLPVELRTHLFDVKSEDIRVLGDKADRLWDSTRQLGSITASVTPSSGRTVSRESQSTAHNATPRATGADHCWYHKKFGERASKCHPPCSFSISGNARNGGTY